MKQQKESHLPLFINGDIVWLVIGSYKHLQQDFLTLLVLTNFMHIILVICKKPITFHCVFYHGSKKNPNITPTQSYPGAEIITKYWTNLKFSVTNMEGHKYTFFETVFSFPFKDTNLMPT